MLAMTGAEPPGPMLKTLALAVADGVLASVDLQRLSPEGVKLTCQSQACQL